MLRRVFLETLRLDFEGRGGHDVRVERGHGVGRQGAPCTEAVRREAVGLAVLLEVWRQLRCMPCLQGGGDEFAHLDRAGAVVRVERPSAGGAGLFVGIVGKELEEDAGDKEGGVLGENGRERVGDAAVEELCGRGGERANDTARSVDALVLENVGPREAAEDGGVFSAERRRRRGEAPRRKIRAASRC